MDVRIYAVNLGLWAAVVSFRGKAKPAWAAEPGNLLAVRHVATIVSARSAAANSAGAQVSHHSLPPEPPCFSPKNKYCNERGDGILQAPVDYFASCKHG